MFRGPLRFRGAGGACRRAARGRNVRRARPRRRARRDRRVPARNLARAGIAACLQTPLGRPHARSVGRPGVLGEPGSEQARHDVDQWSVDFQARPDRPRRSPSPLHSTDGRWTRRIQSPVPHYVGKRVVGTILGFYAITRAPAPNDHPTEAALAFAVGPRAFTIVRFELSDPAGDSSGTWGDYLVTASIAFDLEQRPGLPGRSRASSCSATSRPPGLRSPTRAGRCAGRSRTPAADPLPGPARLDQRQVAGSWRPLATAGTDKKGEFSLRVPARGSYRAVARSNSRHVLCRALFVGYEATASSTRSGMSKFAKTSWTSSFSSSASIRRRIFFAARLVLDLDRRLRHHRQLRGLDRDARAARAPRGRRPDPPARR